MMGGLVGSRERGRGREGVCAFLGAWKGVLSGLCCLYVFSVLLCSSFFFFFHYIYCGVLVVFFLVGFCWSLVFLGWEGKR